MPRWSEQVPFCAPPTQAGRRGDRSYATQLRSSPLAGWADSFLAESAWVARPRVSEGADGALDVSQLSEHDFLRVWGETIRPFYAFVARRAGDQRLSEDVTQEAWLRALELWRRDGLPADPLAWLEAVGANLLRNHFRRERPRPLEADHLVVDVADDRLQTAGPSAAALLQWGLARLRAGQARLLERRHLDGLGLPELAAETGLSVRAVEGRLRRARRDLAKHISPHLADRGEKT